MGDPPSSVRRGRTPSVRPALVVVGIAAGLILLFGIGAAITGGSSTPQRPAAPTRAGGLAAEPAASALRPISKLGTPPTDVLRALVLPSRAKTVSASPWRGQTQYSATMRFSVPAAQASVITFYKTELKSLGWSTPQAGAAHDRPGSTEVLAERTSSDGWYWEVGVVVAPTTFGTGSATDTTAFTLVLFEVPTSNT